MSDVSLAQKLERISQTEKKCFEWIVDNLAIELAEIASKRPNGEPIMITVHVLDPEHFGNKVSISPCSLGWIKDVYSQIQGDSGVEYVCAHAELALLKGHRLVFCQWDWHFEGMEINEEDYTIEKAQEFLEFQPMRHIGSILEPFSWGFQPEVRVPASKKKAVSPQEKDLEKDLLEWIHAKGVKADSQVSTSRHRTDIWIPGKCFLELKKGKVSGDDVCQAIDYCAEYKRPVVIVGNHISEMASRGSEAFNKAVDSEMIAFVTWSAVKTYLKGLFST